MTSRILALGSLLVFLFNAGAHVTTFLEGFPIAQRHIWLFVAATIVLFFAMLGTLVAGVRSEAARMARMSKVSERGQISSDFTRQAVEDIVDVLNAGTLPAAIRKVEQRMVDAKQQPTP